MNQYQEVEIKEIKVGVQPRKFFDEKKMEELTKSVKEKGILQPILVRKSGKKFDLACGERRLRAAKAAGLSKIPSIIRKLTDAQIMEIQFVENLQREDLNPIDEAQGLQGLIKKCGYTQADLADRVGKSQAYIAKRIRLLTLPEKIQRAISREIITPGHGVVILRLGDVEDQLRIFKEMVEKKLSIRNAENYLGMQFGNRLQDAPFDKKDCVKCLYNGDRQLDLFDKDTHLKSKCLNGECYKKKVGQVVKARIDKLKKKGYKVITNDEFRKKYGTAEKDCTDLRTYYSSGYTNLGEKYKTECLGGCKDYLVVADDDGSVNKEICTKKECYRSLVAGAKRQKAKEAGPEGNLTDKHQEQIYENRTIEIKRAEWMKQISTRATKKVANTMMLYFLRYASGPDWWSGRPILDLFKRLGIATKTDQAKALKNASSDTILKRLYTAPEKKTEKEITLLILKKELYDYEDKALDFFAQELGYDIRKDYIISEAYLNTRTKDQLAKLAKEIGLVEFLKKGTVIKNAKVFDPERIADLKKGEIIKLFLKKGFNLKGKVPADIKKKGD
ncbi:hypothetical protein LCGC14_0398980 [marine sediment metagenome]|uniref:HTH cro/C1-type domain-containing protein n=1 Tax=marine sediment metagenome TaxID=412755 RepID=A0A0F9TFG6_9ZZZZ